MYKYREKISFWIQLMSFSGSIMFLLYVVLFGQPRSAECRDCVDKMIYYQHKADSLEQVLHTQATH